jgi:hypothetical protein
MLITALALSAAAIVPLTAHASPRKPVPVHVVDHRVAAAYPHIYWQGTDLGTDPDRRIRFQMRRDADLSSSNH